MRVIKPSIEVLTEIDKNKILFLLERVGRVCYKSEERMTKGSGENFIRRIIKSGHEAMIEHFNITVKFICDRGVTHELVRHRLASFAQESTRFCDYSKDKFKNQLTFILPCWCNEIKEGKYKKNEILKIIEVTNKQGNKSGLSEPLNREAYLEYVWLNHMLSTEELYLELRHENAWQSQQARSILPNSLKTEIVVTTNLREWRHILKLRTAKDAHPQIREIMISLLKEFKSLLPVIFEDIGDTNE